MPIKITKEGKLKKKEYKGPLDNIEMNYAKEVKGAKVERCVEHLMNDPKFKPKKGRTKKESAWAVCRESIGE